MSAEKYVARISASRRWLEDDPDAWERIKRDLIRKYMTELFPPMIGDGLYHVMRFDYYKQENYEGLGTIDYMLVCRHAIANVQNVTIPEMTRVDAYLRSSGMKPACSFCGNTLILDSRGGCKACGAPADGAA